MNRRLTVGALMVIALGAGLWIFLREARGGPEERDGNPTPESIDAVQTGREKEPSKTRKSGPKPLATMPFHEAPSKPEEQQPIEEPLRSGVRVQVLFKESLSPAAHAEILFFETGNLTSTELMALRTTSADMEKTLRRGGRRFRSDAQGEAWVPRDEMAVVGCSHNSHFGYTSLWGHLRQNPQDVVKIELHRASLLRVRVKNQGGDAVASVPVSLRIRQGSYWRDEIVLTTGQDGVAAFTNFELLFKELGAGSAESIASVALAIPLADPVEIPLDPANLPRGDLELTLPAWGSVTVIVMTLKGETVPEGVAHIGTRVDEEDARAEPIATHLPPGISLPIINGKAVFPHVGLGVQLNVLAALDLETYPSQTKGPGPTNPGQDVSFQLRLDADLPKVRVRVVDSRGEGIANSVLGVSLSEENERVSAINVYRIKTDADGRLTVPLREEPTTKVFRRGLGVRQQQGEHNRQSTAIEVPAKLPPGETNLDDIVLRDIPLLVSGLVVDAAGQLMPHAKISLEQKHGTAPNSPWITVFSVNAHSDSTGRFDIHEHIEEEGELRARASMPEFDDSPPVAFQRGQPEVRLILTRGGTVRGSVLVDPGLHRYIHVQMGGSSHPVELGRARSPRISLAADGKFEFKGVAAGSSNVILLLRNDVSLLEIDGIAVRTGEVTQDPRLDGIDLRGRVSLLKVSVRDTAGNPVEDFLFEVTDADHRRKSEYSSEPGLLEVLALSLPVDLRLVKSGYRTVEIKGVRTDRQVTLPPGLRVRCVTTPALPHLEPSFHVTLSLRPIPIPGSARKPRVHDPRGDFNVRVRDNEASFDVATPGEYRISASLVHDTENGSPSMGLPPLGEIVVQDVPGEQVFHIQIPAERLHEVAGLMKK